MKIQVDVFPTVPLSSSLRISMTTGHFIFEKEIYDNQQKNGDEEDDMLGIAFVAT